MQWAFMELSIMHPLTLPIDVFQCVHDNFKRKQPIQSKISPVVYFKLHNKYNNLLKNKNLALFLSILYMLHA